MLYGDEEIIRARVAAQEKELHTIDNEVTIDGVNYTFKRREFDYGFSMVVPEALMDMPIDIAKRKFPYENRPKTILSNSNFRVCLAFSDNVLSSESLENRLESYKGYVKRLNVSNVSFTDGIYRLTNGLRVAHYDYRIVLVASDVYYLTFFADLSDRELLGWFMCPIHLQEKWEPIVRQMIQSIEITETGD